MAEPDLPLVTDVMSLRPVDVRVALLARGIGMSEPEVARALALLKEHVTASSSRRGRLTLGARDGELRAGGAVSATANRDALDFAVDWFARTFFVER